MYKWIVPTELVPWWQGCQYSWRHVGNGATIMWSEEPLYRCEEPLYRCEEHLYRCEEPLCRCEEHLCRCEEPLCRCEEPLCRCEEPLYRCEEPLYRCEELTPAVSRHKVKSQHFPCNSSEQTNTWPHWLAHFTNPVTRVLHAGTCELNMLAHASWTCWHMRAEHAGTCAPTPS